MKRVPLLVLERDGKVLREIALAKERITIGRGPQNDLVVDHLSISGEHAAILVNGREVLVEDMNSTNGTRVNGQPVQRHFLREDDAIEVGVFVLRFYEGGGLARWTSESMGALAGRRSAGACLRLLNGPQSGLEIRLDKPITTIGRVGEQVIAVSRLADRFVVTKVEGGDAATVNGEGLPRAPYELSDGDIVGVSGSRLLFIAFDGFE